ncbi:type II toxin-antitoxin system RelE/ParE family toxin [Ketobacter sp.]|tara:strand:+ start:277 stop:606 length:330 start_codon:yes stop_codon:yes gene_type:complete
MTANFRIKPRAKADLRNIWHYTLERWSEEQADSYIRALFSRFEWLASRPNAGRHRPDIEKGYYCFPEGRHLVFYLVRDGGIDITGFKIHALHHVLVIRKGSPYIAVAHA